MALDRCEWLIWSLFCLFHSVHASYRDEVKEKTNFWFLSLLLFNFINLIVITCLSAVLYVQISILELWKMIWKCICAHTRYALARCTGIILPFFTFSGFMKRWQSWIVAANTRSRIVYDLRCTSFIVYLWRETDFFAMHEYWKSCVVPIWINLIDQFRNCLSSHKHLRYLWWKWLFYLQIYDLQIF